MNYLAHAYLSFHNPHILVGNMISDFVKGSARLRYPPAIQHGIALHRLIDGFTDTHEATKTAMEVFRPHYRLYSGPIVDVLYDHFLANDETIFPGDTLLQFTQEVYSLLEAHTFHLPPAFAHVLVYMKAENWLWNYRTKAGIEKTLKGMARRAAYMKEGSTAFELFTEHGPFLQQCYARFIKDVKNFAKEKFDTLIV